MTEKEKVIFEIQQILRNIAKSESNEPAVIPDGIYSEETAGEVRSFQIENGLPATGKVDYQTFEKLREENERVLFLASLPFQVMPIGNENLPLVYGDENEFVEKLKIMLNFVAGSYSNFEELERNIRFDEKTLQSVKAWQRAIFEEETGEADKAVWNSLAAFYLLKK